MPPLNRRPRFKKLVSWESDDLKDIPVFDDALINGADEFIDDHPLLRRVAEEAKADPIGFISQAADTVRKASRQTHLLAICLSYAMWIKAGSNAAYGKFVVAAQAKRQKRNPRTTSLHLIVENLISYGDGSSEAAKLKRGLNNRDVRAILWLHHKGIPPHHVETEADKLGEGLDAWSRSFSRLKKKSVRGAGKIETPAIHIITSQVAGSREVKTFKLPLEFGVLLDNLLQAVTTKSDVTISDKIIEIAT